MQDIRDVFIETSLKEFQFLIDRYHCKMRTSKKPRLCEIKYQNTTTAVTVGFEQWREQYIFVDIGRVIKGRVMRDPIAIRHDSDLHSFNIEDLLTLRNPSLRIDWTKIQEPLTPESVETIVGSYARAVREHATDILQGDFRIFPELERIVKARIPS
jgi:hypothetical protein